MSLIVSQTIDAAFAECRQYYPRLIDDRDDSPAPPPGIATPRIIARMLETRLHLLCPFQMVCPVEVRCTINPTDRSNVIIRFFDRATERELYTHEAVARVIEDAA